MRKSLSYIFYGVSLARISCRWRWAVPTTPGRKFSVYVDQTLCTILIIKYWFKQKQRIKIIKTATENTNLCGKNMQYAHFAEIWKKCGNMRNMRQSHIRVKLTCLGDKDLSSESLTGKCSWWGLYSMQQWLLWRGRRSVGSRLSTLGEVLCRQKADLTRQNRPHLTPTTTRPTATSQTASRQASWQPAQQWNTKNSPPLWKLASYKLLSTATTNTHSVCLIDSFLELKHVRSGVQKQPLRFYLHNSWYCFDKWSKKSRRFRFGHIFIQFRA